jgi:hypothetical protein
MFYILLMNSLLFMVSPQLKRDTHIYSFNKKYKSGQVLNVPPCWC